MLLAIATILSLYKIFEYEKTRALLVLSNFHTRGVGSRPVGVDPRLRRGKKPSVQGTNARGQSPQGPKRLNADGQEQPVARVATSTAGFLPEELSFAIFRTHGEHCILFVDEGVQRSALDPDLPVHGGVQRRLGRVGLSELVILAVQLEVLAFAVVEVRLRFLEQLARDKLEPHRAKAPPGEVVD